MEHYEDPKPPQRHLIRWNFLLSYFVLIGFWLHRTIQAFLIRNELHPNFAGYGGPGSFLFLFMWVLVLSTMWPVYRTDNITARLVAGTWCVLNFFIFIVPILLRPEVTGTPEYVPRAILYAQASHLLYAFFGKKEDAGF